MESSGHTPVLVDEVIAWLSPVLDASSCIIDCTLGTGGHALALLEAIPGLEVIALDRDPAAIEKATDRLGRFKGQVKLVKSGFEQVGQVVRASGREKADAVFYDLGISSAQLDDPERGFGFGADGPLDMRMDRTQSLTAGQIVNHYDANHLASILSSNADLRSAKPVARAIVKRRDERAIETTSELSELVAGVVGKTARQQATRLVFQAIRIEVNGELAALQESIPQAIGLLAAGGRCAAISYHSGEDRIVKRAFRALEKGCTCPATFPVCVCGRQAVLRVLTKRPIRPTSAEATRNPRSHSGRLRVAQKLGRAV